MDREAPYLVVSYAGTGERELLLLLRPATADDRLPAGADRRMLERRATQVEAGGGRLVSAIVDGTWLQLWTNLTPTELDQVVAGMRLTTPGRPGMATATAGPSPTPLSANVTGRTPPFLRPTTLPAGLTDSGGYGLSSPAGHPTGPLPRPSQGGRPVAPAGSVERRPAVEQIDWAWLAQAWQAMGGGQVTVLFTGPNDRYLELVLVGPVRLDGMPSGREMTTPGGRRVWLLPGETAAALSARWWDGTPVAVPPGRLPTTGARPVLLWAQGESLVHLHSNLELDDLLAVIDGLAGDR